MSEDILMKQAIGQLKWKWFLAPKALIDFETFDLASRGPWGALLLIFRVKARYVAGQLDLITHAEHFMYQLLGISGCLDYIACACN